MQTWTRCAAAVVALGGFVAAQELMYATSRSIAPLLLTADPATGNTLNSVQISNEEALFGGLAFDGTSLWSIDGFNDANSDRTFHIDPATGNGTVVGDTGFNWNFRSVEVHPLTGVLYASRDNELYTIDTTTGVATSVAPITGSMDQLTTISIDHTGTCYGLDIGGTGLFRVDLTTGVGTHLGDLSLPVFAQDTAFDSTGALWCITATGDMYKISVSPVAATYQYSPGPWAGIAFFGCVSPTTYCTAASTTGACVVAIQSNGTPSVTASSGFDLLVNNVDAARTGLFFYAIADPTFTPVSWGAAGPSFLCVKLPTQRMNVLNSGGTTGCTGSFSSDWNAFMAANPGALGNPRTVGARFEAQLWMRDPPSSKTTILSDAVRFELCP